MIQMPSPWVRKEKNWNGALLYAWASDLSRKTDLSEFLCRRQ